MEKSNQLPKTEDCLAEGEPVDLRDFRLERPSRSVSREKREPQAGVASCLSNSASKAADASGDGVSVPEPKTEMLAYGEGMDGLPGSKSVARAQADARNRRGPESPCRTNNEGQAGRAAQRQEAPPGIPGVGSAHSIQWQSRRGGTDTGEGADVLAKPTQATRAIRMTDPTGKPSCERRRRASAKSAVREYRPPGSVRGALGNRRPYLDKAETGERKSQSENQGRNETRAQGIGRWGGQETAADRCGGSRPKGLEIKRKS